ncbi:MAG: Holliday junction resolvase RuvX [Chloroflexi bacterium]|nr:Holliday junction resolvase RuvX [Chloroflexota bacterium]MDA1004763.1 Holliday junction resolvase RuvX [Chloroflexota bacterium]
MRWLGVDFGEIRVGLAICDPDERIAVPLEVVAASAAFPAIRSIVERDYVRGIVIGLPLLPSGDEGETAGRARRLGDRIARALDMPVEYEDERLTTVVAEQMTMRRGPSDDLAATIMLQQFIDRRRLEAQRHNGNGSGGLATHAEE